MKVAFGNAMEEPSVSIGLTKGFGSLERGR